MRPEEWSVDMSTGDWLDCQQEGEDVASTWEEPLHKLNPELWKSEENP